MKSLLQIIVSAVALVSIASASSAAGGRDPSGDWRAFGNTSDQNRHSPLTQITRVNVKRLGRSFTIDFLALNPDTKKGQQSYPLVVDGRMYVTTGDDQVYGLNAATGSVLWHWKPRNSAIFKNFGIVANRGLAYCDGRLFLATLDMHLVALSPRDGRLLARVPISAAVPGAATSYGYSETSAPMCANHVLVVGAAGSEYGVRGFVMAYRPNLRPAWPVPSWTVPPAQQAWRRAGRLVGGGAVWTPTTIDAKTNTLYYGTGSATPLYWPQLRPGPTPRTNSLVAVDLQTGKLKWWQQQLAHNEWGYDTSQPPLVYSAKVGGKTRRVVSVATMEGVWFAYDAATGTPIYQRVKVIDRVEHPSLRPGRPVTIFPSSLGGLNYSPASFDPATNSIVNAAAETAAVLVQKKLTPTEKRRKLLLGDIFLGLENGEFGAALKGWHDHGSISAIDVGTGRRIWKITTPEPERGGVTTTVTGLGFAGGGDGVVRAFDVRNGRILWTFQTGAPIASGPSIYSVAGKEYIAITVGGTPTSSGGGTKMSQLQVFALDGSRDQSAPPTLSSYRASGPVEESIAARAPAVAAARGVPPREAGGAARFVLSSVLGLREWRPSASNDAIASGRLLLGGTPVSGARLAVDGYRVRAPTDRAGRFFVRVDATMPRRHVVRVVSAARARIGKRAPTAAERRQVLRATGGISVAYRLSNLRARVREDGTVLVSGRASVAGGDGGPPPPVVLYTYRLSGRITGADGKPVAGAVLVSRTLDRDFWTFSQPSDGDGRYTSFFPASDEAGSDPVPMSVQVAVGDTSYASPFGKWVQFQRLRSAELDLELPASGASLAVPRSTAVVGGVYDGLLVGVSGPRGVIRPLAARWPDTHGDFSLQLPASARGQTLRFWEAQTQAVSRAPARPGGRVDLRAWPSRLVARIPRGVATARARRR